ncbi:unnamed protein product [Allacma fusca]|uniref:Peptidase S1 domain-containing protein n=1 Tax=Allacma fusca TaxID=39272 RepID=A0A8J2P7B8_9HEXA|nr:unnamed protein product [Allacma fusca]
MGKGTTKGDSGSALICYDEKGPYATGVVSWGPKAGEVLPLTLLSTAMARNMNDTKEERITQNFFGNGIFHGGQITLDQWFSNLPWNFFSSSGVNQLVPAPGEEKPYSAPTTIYPHDVPVAHDPPVDGPEEY